MFRYTEDGFVPGVSRRLFEEGPPGFTPDTPQMELLVECHRAARLLLRLQMHQIHRPDFDQSEGAGQPSGMPIPPPFMPVPGAPPSGANMHRSVGAMRGQGRLLHMLTQNDGVFIKDIVEAFDIRPSSASELVAKLEKQGLVRVESDAGDKRTRKVFLTDAGKALAEKMRPNHDDLFNGLAEEEQTSLLELLKKMNASLAEKSQELEKKPVNVSDKRSSEGRRQHTHPGSTYRNRDPQA